MTLAHPGASQRTLSSSSMSWTRGSVSTSEERVRALRSMGHVGECASARVMQSRQKVCLHDAVVTGLTRADWQMEQTWCVSGGVCGEGEGDGSGTRAGHGGREDTSRKQEGRASITASGSSSSA